MEKEMAQRIEVIFMELARSISKFLGWFCIRLDYYVEAKEWELEQRRNSFPKEWFVDDDKDYKGNPNFLGDD
jgi:hypothetical protein